MRLLRCLAALCLLLACVRLSAHARQPSTPPNLVVIFVDDLGYGDLGSYGHPTIRTPALDRMAAEGMRFTQFYVAASVCTPSRAGLLTGRLPIRTGMTSNKRGVLFPNSKYGLPHEEITIAELLKEKRYATSIIGKWHLGHLPEFLPTRQGFDAYYGIPYSNDMDKPGSGSPPTPILRGETIEEQPADQTTLTRRYTEEAVRFIRSHRDGPFFLYFAHTFPHVPLFASPDFKDKSIRGLYGDVVEELDWSVGQVLGALRELGLEKNTLVLFTSDNGPWLTQNEAGGSAGLLREGKGSAWEGGYRVPAIAWWPGVIEPSVSRALASTLDIFPMAAELSGAALPTDRAFDGRSLLPLLTGRAETIRDVVYYYRGQDLYALRKGPWKAHFVSHSGYGPEKPAAHEPPLLYNLEADPSEKYDVAAEHPDVLRALQEEAARQRAALPPRDNWLDAIVGQ